MRTHRILACTLTFLLLLGAVVLPDAAALPATPAATAHDATDTRMLGAPAVSATSNPGA